MNKYTLFLFGFIIFAIPAYWYSLVWLIESLYLGFTLSYYLGSYRFFIDLLPDAILTVLHFIMFYFLYKSTKRRFPDFARGLFVGGILLIIVSLAVPEDTWIWLH